MNVIEIQNLSYIYPGGKELVLKDLTFSISKGEIFGFLGPSGAGKSTTQKIITKQLFPSQGQVTVMGRALDAWTTDLYNYIGIGFELPNHYLKLTALENLQFFSAFYDRPIKNLFELLEMVGLRHYAHQRVEHFSKGMKMRLNFIRAIMHDPPILFLDEPTSGLDPANARIIKDIILQLKAEGKTIFLTTHNMHDADELCDKVAFIFDGQIVALGSPRQLKQKVGEKKVMIHYFQDGVICHTIFALQDIGQNNDFLDIIATKVIDRIETQESSLEQLFIKLTGQNIY